MERDWEEQLCSYVRRAIEESELEYEICEELIEFVQGLAEECYWNGAYGKVKDKLEE